MEDDNLLDKNLAESVSNAPAPYLAIFSAHKLASTTIDKLIGGTSLCIY